ncbi:hypothetical protein DQ04_24071000 [Trypanosoma grayi]|uniref:hypothetical protein n=1 Tax=Trypanosoma grayi TaxID=71804 RepID=UPI0004F4371C|nr:hypothetical protein DQ04_24071000 [Trypanosoma grayi]KEG05284.1 hypothetical protein DQ04_24071000 [Trypanosoma grayi]
MLAERLQKYSGVSEVQEASEGQEYSVPCSTQEASTVVLHSGFAQIESLLKNSAILLGALGLANCLAGLYLVFMMRFERDVCRNAGNPEEGVLCLRLIRTYFDLFRPFLMSLLAVGVLMFYQLVIGSLLSE